MAFKQSPLEKRVPFWNSLTRAFQADIRALDETVRPSSWYVGVPTLDGEGRVVTIGYLCIVDTKPEAKSTVILLSFNFQTNEVHTQELSNNIWKTGYEA